MLLENIHILGQRDYSSAIKIADGSIENIFHSDGGYKSTVNDLSIRFENAVAFPGLINSHDHLEFNLFPKLGHKTYRDYIEWGEDIHQTHKSLIGKIKNIPYGLRYLYGLYKNLIVGVTTVVHHGNGAVFQFDNLPDVHAGYNYLHSTRLQKKWRLKLNLLFRESPVLIHTGEGTNDESSGEITDLLKWNLFGRNLIGIHGISLNENQSKKFKAIVWCPDSNLFLYNKTADISNIKNHTDILFGTDSNVSSDWNIWNHIRLAKKLAYLSDIELFESLTLTPAKTWNLGSKGKLYKGGTADIVIARKRTGDNFESFYAINPEDILLIIKNGNPVFIDEQLSRNNPKINTDNFEKISINNSKKFVTNGIIGLMKSIRNYLPDYNFPFSAG